jgi:hypothetical protein
MVVDENGRHEIHIVEDEAPMGMTRAATGERAARYEALLREAGTSLCRETSVGVECVGVSVDIRRGRRYDLVSKTSGSPIAPTCDRSVLGAASGLCQIEIGPSWFIVYNWQP